MHHWTMIFDLPKFKLCTWNTLNSVPRTATEMNDWLEDIILSTDQTAQTADKFQCAGNPTIENKKFRWLTLSLPSSKPTFSQTFEEKCTSEVQYELVVIIFHLSNKLWKAKFFILCDEILLKLWGKFELDHSWEWKDWEISRVEFGVKTLEKLMSKK